MSLRPVTHAAAGRVIIAAAHLQDAMEQLAVLYGEDSPEWGVVADAFQTAVQATEQLSTAGSAQTNAGFLLDGKLRTDGYGNVVAPA